MKKILFFALVCCVSLALSGQDMASSIKNSYFRIDDSYFDSRLLFLENGNLILKSIKKDTYSLKELLRGRYIQQKDRILLAPPRREAFFEVSYRQNQHIEKGKIRLTFNLKEDIKEMYYAFQNDTLADHSVLTALEDLVKEPTYASSNVVIEKEYHSTLILKKTDGRDQFVMTYEIPADANDLYIEYFGYSGESSMLYLFSVEREADANELTLKYNIRGEGEELPLKAYYIRPVTDEDFAGISFTSDELLYGYSYLDPADFYYYRKPYEQEDDLDDSYAESEETVEEEALKNEKELTDADRWQLLYDNKTKLEPVIKAKGKQMKQAAETYFSNLFEIMGDAYNDYGGGWSYFSEEFNSDTTAICPSHEEVSELLDVYAENELKRNKFDITAAKIIYRYYSENYFYRLSTSPRLSASVRYLIKYADTINEFGQSKSGYLNNGWYLIETLLDYTAFQNDEERRKVYREVLQLAPAYRDFLMLNFDGMNHWNAELLAEYLDTFKGWDMQKFREHNEFMKRLAPSYYENYSIRSGEHPIRFCNELSWLLNRVATNVYQASWQEKSPYVNNAIAWARMSTELCTPSVFAEYLDIYACLLYQAGEKEKALQMSSLALRSLPEERQNEFIYKKVSMNYKLIKQDRLTSERAWLE